MLFLAQHRYAIHAILKNLGTGLTQKDEKNEKTCHDFKLIANPWRQNYAFNSRIADCPRIDVGMAVLSSTPLPTG
jgi:hypothetical protein